MARNSIENARHKLANELFRGAKAILSYKNDLHVEMDDVRYSELVFLQKLAANSPEFEYFYPNREQPKIVGLKPITYVEMAVTLLEEGCICFERQECQLLVTRLRGELAPKHPCPSAVREYHWTNPREGIHELLNKQEVFRLRVTYKGLRRIEELRDLLRRDRILEPFGVLLDLRYLHTDLQLAVQRSADNPISVLYADLDGFKQVNDNFGHAAGDVVLKAYLETVRDLVGPFGMGYRGRGDEVVAVIVGQGHERAVKIAEQIRKAVEMMHCVHDGKPLRNVTASIGVATAPPESRSVEVESIAEHRNRQAKKAGKNRVISS